MHSVLRLRRYIAFTFLAVATSLTPAGLYALGFQPPVQNELKMTSEPQAPDAPAIILFRQLDRNNARMEGAVEDNYYRIKILTDEGRKQAELQIPFVKGQETISYIKARSIQPDGTIAEFKGEPEEKVVRRPNGTMVQAMTLTIPGVQTGSVIEYFYRVTSSMFGPPPHWTITQDLFTRSARFSLMYSWGGMFPVWNWLPAGVPQPTYGDGATTGGGSVKLVRLDAKNIPGFTHEDLAPPEGELKSTINFTPIFQRPELIPEKFWKSFGLQRYNEMESFVSKGNLQSAVSEIVAKDDAPEVKLRKIYERVQQMRPAGFQNPGAMPKNAAELWKAGSGFPAQANWLFLALARAAGFEAHGVVVASRRDRFFRIPAMDSGHLNTNLVAVKLNGGFVFCEPAGTLAPFGMLPWTETGVKGLLLDKDGGSWIDVPLTKSTDSQVARTAQLKLSPTGDLEGKLTVTYTGLEASSRRSDRRFDPEPARKGFLEYEVKSYIPGASTVELTNKPDWTGTGPLVAEFTLKATGWAAAADGKLAIPTGLFGAREKSLFAPAQRHAAIYFEYPSLKADDITLELPTGFKVGALPKPRTVDGGQLKFIFAAESRDATVRIRRILANDANLLPASAYQPLRDFFQIVKDSDTDKVVLQAN